MGKKLAAWEKKAQDDGLRQRKVLSNPSDEENRLSDKVDQLEKDANAVVGGKDPPMARAGE